MESVSPRVFLVWSVWEELGSWEPGSSWQQVSQLTAAQQSGDLSVPAWRHNQHSYRYPLGFWSRFSSWRASKQHRAFYLSACVSVTVVTIQQHLRRPYNLFAQVQVVLANSSSMSLLQEKVWSEGTMLRWIRTVRLCGLSSLRAAGRHVTATSTPAAAPMDTSMSWEGGTAAVSGISGGTALVRRDVAPAFFWT